MSILPISFGRRALVDTSAYYALADLNESRHDAAAAIQRRLIQERWQLFTTNFLMGETHALLLIRLGHAVALRFLDALDGGSTSMVRVTEEDEGRARAIIRQYDDKSFSFVDATSFAVMERLGIAYAFTFDRNFAQFGFTLLTPSHFSER